METMDTWRGYPETFTFLIPSGSERMMGKKQIGRRGYPHPFKIF